MTNNKYQEWIDRRVPKDPTGLSGLLTLTMLKEFPELRRVRGYYHCPMLTVPFAHWWLVTKEGCVIDPTSNQFVSKGAGRYEESSDIEPMGNCMRCGTSSLDPDHMPFCSRECQQIYVEAVSDLFGEELEDSGDEG